LLLKSPIKIVGFCDNNVNPRDSYVLFLITG
jgi:hypothetical protein